MQSVKEVKVGKAAKAAKAVPSAPAAEPGHEVFRPKVVEVSIGRLNPAPYNPRRMGEAAFKALKANVRAHGFLQPLVVQKKGWVVIAGHQRLRALKEICLEDRVTSLRVPCVVLDVGDREAKKLNLSLNKITGDWDAKKLGELFIDLRGEDAVLNAQDFAATGFQEDEILKYIRFVEPPNEEYLDDDMSTFGTSVTLSLEFKDVRIRDAVKTLLKQKTEMAKKPSGEYVADLLGISVPS